MGKKRSSSKSPTAFVDEETSISVIENQEFMAMRTAVNSWPTPSTKEE